jgi:hypothetical protein
MVLHYLLPEKWAELVVRVLFDPRYSKAAMPLTAIGHTCAVLALFTNTLPPAMGLMGLLGLPSSAQLVLLADVDIVRLLAKEFELW